jgi:phospholipid transport system substrate-binding protein
MPLARLETVLLAGAPLEASTPEGLVHGLTAQLVEALAHEPRDAVRAVDATLRPYVDVTRLTFDTAGRHWRKATADQQQRLQAAYWPVVVRALAEGLGRLEGRVTVVMKPPRLRTPNEAMLATELTSGGGGTSVPLDFRLEQTKSGWKVHDFALFNLSLVDQHRAAFAAEVEASGMEGLVARLEKLNQAAAAR